MKKLVASLLTALIMVGLAQVALAALVPSSPTTKSMGYYTVKFVYEKGWWSTTLVPVAAGKKFWLMDDKYNFVASGLTDASGCIRYFVLTNINYLGAVDRIPSSLYWHINKSYNPRQVNTSVPQSLIPTNLPGY